tara:strand:+ start:419 stop:604 length:186 start_codon:yes stop_codon:yes gene_type:complete
MNDTYSAKKHSKRYTSKAMAAAEYLDRDCIDGDQVVLHVHSAIMGKSFLKSFKVRVDNDTK